MIKPAQLFRVLHINRVLVRHGLDEIILATHLFRPVRMVQLIFPWRWFRRHQQPQAERIRLCLEDLGPIFIKFGQMLSTRPDLLPVDIAQELAKLQDQVPPFSIHDARQRISQALGDSIENLFAEFEDKPLASASIAQVHAATLNSGERVVVKVVRPGIEKIIKRDISLLHTLADLAERYWSEARRLRAKEVVADYEKTIIDELDLQREAASASQLRRNFKNSKDLYIPDIYWSYTRHSVMVMERISGIPIGDVNALKQAGIDLKSLSERGVEIFFTQVFKHNFFHADMHPGNIFVANDGQYIAVDFGIVGSLTTEDQRYLAENFLAFFNRDYRRVAELHVLSGWVPTGTRIEEFESAIRTVCEPIFEKPLKDISFGQVLLRLFQTARRFDMEIQPQLVLLQKTLLNIEGLGRELNPELDLWQTAKPFLENWMLDRAGPKAVLKSLRQQFPGWLEQLPQVPDLVYNALSALNQRSDARSNLQAETQTGHSKTLITSIVYSSFFIASLIAFVLSLLLANNAVPVVASLSLWSWFFAAGTLVVLSLLVRLIRRL
ncbi:MAG: ubiquinone biosynthesis regulatory protein kinase UbiB [Gammaproteobacteria bacterium]|nr:ubiquinone biosynthesis regulatory protein kinase UbiB [Gammaproteobacteria bacterium]MDH5728223.1 ubiquinone biosynthesis regulatory protein kinase UbiB [Gammaproteobacteria bacterium]